MVVKTRRVIASELDLPYLGFFLGLRVNELVLRRMEAGGFKGLRESHGYLIQHLIGSARTVTELARRMDVTQQAASKAVAELMGLAILEEAPAKDRRVKRVQLSRVGRKAVRLGRDARRRIEKRLANAAGKENHREAKFVLLSCLRALGGLERIRARRVRQPP